MAQDIMSPSKTYTSLLEAAKSLCNAFSSHSTSLLDHFSSSPYAFEHGNPALAPFLGREFTGRAGVADYFAQLHKHLSHIDMHFWGYVVDEVEKKVSVSGEAFFTWKATNVVWHENFTYTLEFLEEDGVWKVEYYKVWADSGSL